MRKPLILFILLIVIFFGCNGSDDNLRNNRFKCFKVTIEQDGLIKQAIDNKVTLSKRPFFIVLYLRNNDRIFVNASFNNESFSKTQIGAPLSEIDGFKGAEIAEELFNKEKVLYVSDKAPNYWYFLSESDHRFTSVTKANGMLICKREIINIKDINKNEESIDIKDMSIENIYLIFMKYDWNEDFSQKIEKKRDVLQLVFTEKSD